MPTTVRSFSKINLGLAVGPPRPDGFHGLATCYQTLALQDLVTLRAARSDRTEITLEANHPGVPRTQTGDAERNTAFQIVAGALERLGMQAQVHITLDKRLPVQGGLGAGSANAAAALLALERELGLALPGPERLLLAAEVGSDVPLFLLGGSVLGLGRGEEVYPLPDLPELPCVIAVPAMGVSTARAFRALDQRGSRAEPHGGLTSGDIAGRLKQLSRTLAAVWTTSGAESGSQYSGPTGIACRSGDLAENPLLALVRTGIENDFEEVVFSEHPSLRSTKRDLMGLPGAGGALYAALSGSGSALFGIYRTRADAEVAQQRVEASGTQAIVTSTIGRPMYWQSMFC